MNKIAVAVGIALIGTVALSNVQRARPRDEATLYSYHRGATMTTGGPLGAHKLPAGRPFRISAFAFNVTTAAATATVSQVIRCTDGTNNCDCTTDCTTTDIRAAGPKRCEALSGTCTFPGGAAISCSVTTQCTTAQPTVQNCGVVGFWQ